ncbi:MAG TPA: hypothetical protein VEO01_00275, partial [Pseudonocardiaceae bacterium]|nr:hypothetical protein [Pseudonocardiaceae bacterium]
SCPPTTPRRPGDLRGITAIELSVLQARLTRRTRNVTVILDCCHAAHQSRRHDLRVRALYHPTYLDVAEHNAMLSAMGLPENIVDPIQPGRGTAGRLRPVGVGVRVHQQRRGTDRDRHRLAADGAGGGQYGRGDLEHAGPANP